MSEVTLIEITYRPNQGEYDFAIKPDVIDGFLRTEFNRNEIAEFLERLAARCRAHEWPFQDREGAK